jgi:hypothetical protein
MQLMLFDDKNSWIEIEKGFSIKIDYCNVKQQMKLEVMLDNYRKVAMKEDKVVESEEAVGLFYEYATYYVKYHIKDWKGVSDGKKDLLFELENDEMKDNLWKGLVNNTNVFWKLFNAIHTKLRFNETDKKK